MDQEEFRRRLMKPLDKIHADSHILSLAENSNPSKSIEDNNFMTLEKYITNPTGKGSAYVANRQAIKTGLNLTFIKLLREYRRYFYAIPYIYPDGKLLFYVKVPSEDFKNNKISYDVLFLFDYDQRKERKNRKIQLYSNSPSFIFTYCYVYNKNGLIIENLKDKLPNEALTIPPEVRNPIGSYGFEKSTYIAGKYLIEGRCLTDAYINRYGKTMTQIEEAALHRKIADPELLVSIYQHAKYNERKTHRKELSANEKARRDAINSQYASIQKKERPKAKLFGTSPRSKITAKKAKKNFIASTIKRK